MIAGILTGISRRGDLIVKLKGGYGGETHAFDAKGRRVGEVRRVTGPVNGPYVILKSLLEDPNQLNRVLGREIFLRSGRGNRGEKRRKGKESGRYGRRRI